jgi:diaminopropionate ammonia-lyase
MIMIYQGDGVAVFANPTSGLPTVLYGEERSGVLNEAGFQAAEQEIHQWPGYRPTRLHRLPDLAAHLGLKAIYYKDESTRFALKSFKALGGAYAVFRLIQQTIANACGGHIATPAEVLSGKYADIVSGLTVTCATDGNHGRSVAWGAQTFGARCVIFVHATVSQGRADAIAAFGAEVIRVAGNYDDSVRHAADQAEQHGWTVVSDTTYEDYREIPIDVMHGYGVMARELVQQLHHEPPTHVIVQAGVGGLAAAVCAVFWLVWGLRRPRFVLVEPENAACFFVSAQAGEPVAVTGTLDTVMAGLACGEVSPAAWEVLREGVMDYAMLADRYALQAMRQFAQPRGDDRAIVSGETGAVGLGLLMAAKANPTIRQALGLTVDSRVLLLGSEGDTDPDIYQAVVGKTATQVLA